MERPLAIQLFIQQVGTASSLKNPNHPISPEASAAAYAYVKQLRQISTVKREMHLRAFEVLDAHNIQEITGNAVDLEALMNLMLDLESNYIDPSVQVQHQVVATSFDAPTMIDPNQTLDANQIPDAWAGFPGTGTNPFAPPLIDAIQKANQPQQTEHWREATNLPKGYLVPKGPQFLFSLQITANSKTESELVLAETKQAALAKSTKLSTIDSSEEVKIGITQMGEVTA